MVRVSSRVEAQNESASVDSVKVVTASDSDKEVISRRVGVELCIHKIIIGHSSLVRYSNQSNIN